MDNGCTVEYGTIRSWGLPGQWQNIYCWRLLLVCKALHQSYSGTIFDSHAKYTILKLKLYDLLKYTILGILELYDHFPGISWSFNRNLSKWQYTFVNDRILSVRILNVRIVYGISSNFIGWWLRAFRKTFLVIPLLVELEEDWKDFCQSLIKLFSLSYF